MSSYTNHTNNTNEFLKQSINRGRLVGQSLRILLTNFSLLAITLLAIVISFMSSSLLYKILTGTILVVIRTLVSSVTVAFATGAQISMVDAIADGRAVRLGYGFRAGMHRLIPLVILNILIVTPAWIILAIESRSFLYVFSSSLGQPGGVQAMTVFGHLGSIAGIDRMILIINLLANVMGIGAERAIVLENKPIALALKRSWQLVKRNLADYIVIGLLLLGVTLLAWLLLTFTNGLILNSSLTNSIHTSVPYPGSYFTSPAYAILTVLQMLVDAAVQVFTSGMWTLAFRKWQGR